MNQDDMVVLQELREKMIRIELLLENNNTINAMDRKALEARVKKLEDAQTWLWRAFIAGFLTGLFGILFSLVKITN